MKRYLYNAFCALTAAWLCVSCDKESGFYINESPSTNPGEIEGLLSVTAVMQDFTDKGVETRASESGTTLSFQNGDAIGVFGVSGGTVKQNNLRFTYTNGKWSGPELYHENGVTYYAYFPYESGMSGKNSLNAIQSTFESRLDGNPNQGNATEYMKYCQLLVSSSGSVTPAGTQLSFTFKHALAMVEFTMPDKLEGFMQSLKNNHPIYNPSSISCVFSIGGSSSCYNISGKTYRRIVKPNKAIPFSATLCGRFKYAYDLPSVSAGNYKKIVLQNLALSLEVGDFVYGGDGGTLSFFPGSTTSDAPDKDKCIGVVATVKGEFGDDGTVIAKKNIVGVKLANYTTAAGNYSPKAPGGCSWYLQDGKELHYLCQGSTDTDQTGTSMRDKLDPYLERAGGEKWYNTSPIMYYWTSDYKHWGGSGHYYFISFGNGIYTYNVHTPPSTQTLCIRPSFRF